jgi:hypothetical protein
VNDRISVKETNQILVVYEENSTYLRDEEKSYGVDHPNLAERYGYKFGLIM